MCTLTKTSYGCGHDYRNTEDCRESRCPGLDKYLFRHDGDCRPCKSGGTAVTRGKEGKGRYAQQHKLQTKQRSTPADVSATILPEYQAPGPWAPTPSQPRDIEDKLWQKPTRQQADHAWVAEHEERQQSISPRNSPSARELLPDLPAPRYRPEHHFEEMMQRVQDLDLRSERRGSPDNRQNSYDSLQSVEIEERRPRTRSHSHRSSHGGYSHGSRTSQPLYGSFDSGFNVVSSSPRSYGTSRVQYDTHEAVPSGYSVSYGSGHGVAVTSSTRYRRY